jgi:hypothetical protein
LISNITRTNNLILHECDKLIESQVYLLRYPDLRVNNQD